MPEALSRSTSLAHHLAALAEFAPRQHHAVRRFFARYGYPLERSAYDDQVAAIRSCTSRLIGHGWGGRELHAIDVVLEDGSDGEVFAVWDPRAMMIVTYLDRNQQWRGGLVSGAANLPIRRARG